MTAYNRAMYITEAIQSIIDSSYKSFELIIVDDGSSDRTLEIAHNFSKVDERIRVYQNEKNLGDYPNRNKAASYATGKYLKYLDADDVIYPYSLQIMVEAMENYQKAGLALSFNIIDDTKPYPQLIEPQEAYKSFFLCKNVLGVGPSAAIIRRKCFESVGGFSGRQYVGDTELWLKLAGRYPVVKLQPSLVWWRRHENQQMKSELKNYDVLNVRHRMMLDVLDNCGNLLTDPEKAIARKFHTYRHARTVWNLAIKQKKLIPAFRLFRDSRLTIWNILTAIKNKNL